MKLSIILPVIAALTLAACGNLSKVSKEGTTDNPVWPDAAKLPSVMMVLSMVLGRIGITSVKLKRV